MDLKLVYRALRQISEWSVQGFYSEVYVEGKENVEPDGPLVISSTHHNELIDIATLTITVPHRRHLSFWAKSSMFANPLMRAILSSSGAIPVRRNPNIGTSPSSSTTRISPPQNDLFRETSNALAAGEVIVVFPEGTSYTQPNIVQVMPGAAWAAVEYARWAHNMRKEGNLAKPIKIIPTSVVYTDKSRYLSRVYVRYGKPIIVDNYAADIFEEGVDADIASRLAVKNIMEEVKRQMTEMTVNAPDWDTLYSAQMARDMLWGDPTKVPLKDWVEVSQTLVNIFEPSVARGDPILSSAKSSLTKYFALLQHTGIQHATLDPLLHIQQSSYRQYFALHLLRMVPHVSIAFMSFVLFLPAMLFHLPAYITGSLSGKALAAGGEEEAMSQYKSVGGGVGLGLGAGVILSVFRLMGGFWWTSTLFRWQGGWANEVQKWIVLAGAAYSSFYLLVKWHRLFVCRNYKRFKTLLTICKLCFGLVISKPISTDELRTYIRPPPPPPNPFIRKQKVKHEAKELSEAIQLKPKTLCTARLIRPLLDARVEAFASLDGFLQSKQSKDLEFLRNKGARIPCISS